MRFSRKVKLVLGLCLGSIISTAAITTMAVSCSNEDSSNLYSYTNVDPQVAKLFPESAIAQMGTKFAQAFKKSLPEEGKDTKLNHVTTKISLDGSLLTILLDYSLTHTDNNTIYEMYTKMTIDLLNVNNGEYTSKQTIWTNDNGNITGSKEVPEIVTMPKQELITMLNNIYETGSPDGIQE